MLIDLPIELLPHVLAFLPFKSHLTLRLASKILHNVLCSESIHMLPQVKSFVELAQSLPQIANSIVLKTPRTSSGPVERVLFIPGSAALMVTVQSFKRSLRISVRALGLISMPLSQCHKVMAEAISAKRGDCAQVRIVSTEKALWSQHTSIVHDVYRVTDYGGEPAIRIEMGKPGGASRHLAAWMMRGKSVELNFKGGGDWFVSERYCLKADASTDGPPIQEPTVILSVSNVERVDTVDVSKEEGKDADAQEMANRMQSLCRWIVELWVNIEAGNAAAHADLTSKRFKYIRQ
ncbi:hypothetical protein BC829DRAFT_397274 [Chytridium lagenaria]|nr:hypothetical protein BC829DRAFT_397274 [Chytridium lagenaria]